MLITIYSHVPYKSLWWVCLVTLIPCCVRCLVTILACDPRRCTGWLLRAMIACYLTTITQMKKNQSCYLLCKYIETHMFMLQCINTYKYNIYSTVDKNNRFIFPYDRMIGHNYWNILQDKKHNYYDQHLSRITNQSNL